MAAMAESSAPPEPPGEGAAGSVGTARPGPGDCPGPSAERQLAVPFGAQGKGLASS